MREIKGNLIGKVFGKLTVIDYKVGKNGGIRCDCRCECGNEKKDIPIGDLINKHDTSCGCARTKYKEDLTGRTVNHLTVIGIGNLVSERMDINTKDGLANVDAVIL